jgi:23S rRNA pseudouridine1911/1915/1917 synthase
MPQVLYVDNHLLCLSKPVGMPAQPDASGVESVYDWGKSWIRNEKGKVGGDVFCGVVHRLDRYVSGVTVLARTSKAASRLSRQFADRSVDKTYLGLVSPPPAIEATTLTHYLEKNEKINRVTVHGFKGLATKEAITSYTVVHRDGDRALLEVFPKTGRPHQIRAQLAVSGSAIVGDRKYGSTVSFEGLGLHALALEFEHPVKKERIRLVAMPPASWGEEVVQILSARGWTQEVLSPSQSRG